METEGFGRITGIEKARGTMGIFDKKQCSICGKDIGIVVKYKLEDGNLCKDCAEKLSPWFDERRHSTVEQIKAQLAYREENRPKAAAFNTTRSYGRCPSKLLIDEGNGTFMITSAADFAKSNPDVLELTQITSTYLDVQEHKSEQKKKDAEGKMVSYNPPRYEYSYDFYMKLSVNHPYIDDMRFRLNPSAVKTGNFSQKNSGAGMTAQGMRPTTVGDAAMSGLAAGVAGALGVNNRVGYNAEYEQYMALGNEIIAFIDSRRYGHGQAVGPYGAAVDPYSTGAGQPYAGQQAYNGAQGQPYTGQPGYSNTAGQPYAAQQGYNGAQSQAYAPQQMNNGAPAQSYDTQPAGGVVRKIPCPYCGEMTTPTADGRCEFCMGKVYG
jgi:hypothetical protein